jgi:ATP-dependent Clp protease ATP-binding subunit ClpA
MSKEYAFDEEEEDDFDDEKRYASSRSGRSKTPVVDNFTTPFAGLLENDKIKGLTYFIKEPVINTLQKALLKTNKNHIAIVGELGTGRESLIKILAQRIENGTASFSLEDYRILQLELESVMTGTKYNTQIDERFKAIYNEAENSGNIIFYIRDLFRLFAADNNQSILSNNLLRFVRSKKTKIICVLTQDEFDKLSEFDGTFPQYFNVIKISPPSKEESIEIIKRHIPRFISTFSVEIPDELIPDVIEFSNLYLVDGYQPIKSINLIEEICATKELQRATDPNDAIHAIQVKYEEMKKVIQQLKDQKNTVVKNQKFEEAAALRDQEKSYEEKLSQIKRELDNAKKSNNVKASIEDIYLAIHSLTGFDIEKIKKKEQLKFAILSPVQKEEHSALPKYEQLQAQSILQGSQISIKTGLAFVLIPFNEEFDEIYDHYIKPALEHHGLNVLKADSIYKPGNILSQIWSLIRSAEVIIADVSGKNANVIFELGLCYGIQRCPILLTRDPNELPFNIRNLRYINYENTAAGIHKLSVQLKTAVGEFLSTVRSE